MTQPRTILLVEGNPDLREATAALLRELSYRVETAATAAQALTFLESATAVDLLVVNAYLGETGGLDLLARARRRRAGLAALLLSGFGEDTQLRRQAAAEGVAVLQLPYSAAALAAAVDASSTSVPPVGSRDGASRPRSTWPLALAASLTLAGGLFVATWRPGAPELPPPPAATEATRSGAVTGLAPQGELDSLPHRFEWQPVAGAAAYEVVLTAVDGVTIWSAETEASSIAPPAEVVSSLQPNVVYHWYVEAHGERQETLAASRLAQFRSKL